MERYISLSEGSHFQKYISLRKETKAMAEKEKNKSKIELKSLTLLFYSEAIKEKK